MSIGLDNWLVVVYLSGGLVTVINSIRYLLNINRLKTNSNLNRLFQRSDMSLYLIIKPILWPYFFVTEKSPTERLSELFFKHYGDEGHIYFGNQGIKNFLNDLVKGKERYKDYSIKSMCWSIDKGSQEWLSYKKVFGDELNAQIIYTKIEDTYLLSVTWTTDNTPQPVTSVSRFKLDRCARLKESEFKTRIKQINAAEANRLCYEIELKAD
ncbi:hypothetical protein Lsan_0432 [Legionella santicrucis]|uniref:Uncharacterized protein n=1 Tax=Legionella santicrucis TaxID=45074 RepID=A0A0W0ZBN4_9GAMM|nr:hypothetical protein [Legionella santicrucis]KTD66487.1 hypothetical protein Lsan_0432 [Legionella santicrucis]